MIVMFRKKPILEYESSLEIYTDPITPSKKHIPKWYKNIPQWKNNEMFSIENGLQYTVKSCVPFLDSLTTGYMITLPYDIYIKNDNGMPYLTWADGVKFPPKWRKEVSDQNIIPFEHSPIEYTWNYCVSFRVPKGYSFLFTHPLNRHDLPFTTLSGVIDGDFVMYAHGNVPFYIKKDFEGLIPQGTPIAQIIPFRQESWQSKKTKGLEKIGNLHNDQGQNVFYGWYKKIFWKRKNYN